MLELILVITFALPIAWLASEAQSRRWISVVLGLTSIIVTSYVAYALGGITPGLQANQSFGNATKTLVTTITDELENGKVDFVTRELRGFAESYNPTYENYPRYDKSVLTLVQRLKQPVDDAE